MPGVVTAGRRPAVPPALERLNEMILELDGVQKKFGGLIAVNQVSLSVEEGQIFGLIGPNGAGKTTLLNMIAGALKPDGGRIRFLGQDVTGLRAYRICQRGVARTFQISRPFPRLTALENVMVSAAFGNRGGVANQAAHSAAMLELVEFPAAHDTLAEDLNTVQLKRLDLARALASQPRLLLLDEIGAGLTPAELNELIALIRRIRDQGITIIAVEHLLKVIMGISDRIAVLDYGVKIADDSPAQIARNRQVIDVYLGDKYLVE
jgi:branched-chain amino acid transport system ATP-binding protein